MINSGIENVDVAENKGNYRDVKKTSANALYKDYKKYVLSQGKTPLPYAAWIEWAKQKGVVPSSFKAEADQPEAPDSEMAPMAKAISNSGKIFMTVLFVSAAILIAMNFTKTENKPQ